MNTSELIPKTTSQIISQLEEVVDLFSPATFVLSHIDISDFQYYYNEYGPEQRNLVEHEMDKHFKIFQAKGFGFYHAKVDYGQFICLLRTQGAVWQVKEKLDAVEFPVYDENLEAKKIQSEAGELSLDPRKLDVHIGSTEISTKDNIKERIDALLEAAKESKMTGIYFL